MTQGVLAQGSYLLAVQGIWQNSKSYLDVRVVADLGYTITTDTVGTGTVTPPSPSYVFSGGSYTALYKAGTGYHVASVAVDNQVKILSQSSYLPAETTLTINPVTKNYSIKGNQIEKKCNKYVQHVWQPAGEGRQQFNVCMCFQ